MENLQTDKTKNRKTILKTLEIPLKTGSFFVTMDMENATERNHEISSGKQPRNELENHHAITVMGKLTISMAMTSIANCKRHYQRV